jgi:hypothetical protein
VPGARVRQSSHPPGSFAPTRAEKAQESSGSRVRSDSSPRGTSGSLGVQGRWVPSGFPDAPARASPDLSTRDGNFDPFPPAGPPRSEPCAGGNGILTILRQPRVRWVHTTVGIPVAPRRGQPAQRDGLSRRSRAAAVPPANGRGGAGAGGARRQGVRGGGAGRETPGAGAGARGKGQAKLAPAGSVCANAS